MSYRNCAISQLRPAREQRAPPELAMTRRGRSLWKAAGATDPYTGTAIFPTTCPVSVTAAFTSPSVPAENKWPPSGLNTNVRQLPLCLRVRHAVSMVPWPSHDAASPVVAGGRRWIWTWPDARPRARSGEVG